MLASADTTPPTATLISANALTALSSFEYVTIEYDVLFTNGANANFTNAAFITYQVSTLSIPRMGVYEDTLANATKPEANLDMFVSTDPTLLTLNPVAIANCLARVGNNRAALANAGTQLVTVALGTGDFAATGATVLSNYVLPTSVSGNGLVNQATITGSVIVTPTKVYDGSTAATLTAANFLLTGFVSGEGATVSQTAGSYASANASGTVNVKTTPLITIEEIDAACKKSVAYTGAGAVGA